MTQNQTDPKKQADTEHEARVNNFKERFDEVRDNLVKAQAQVARSQRSFFIGSGVTAGLFAATLTGVGLLGTALPMVGVLLFSAAALTATAVSGYYTARLNNTLQGWVGKENNLKIQFQNVREDWRNTVYDKKHANDIADAIFKRVDERLEKSGKWQEKLAEAAESQEQINTLH